MKLVKSRTPTLIGHDNGTCEFSPHLQSFGWQFEVGLNNVDISLTNIENEMKQF